MSPYLIGNHKEIPITHAEVMGILNITPDSFYSGSRIGDLEVLKSAEGMLRQGALILDIGGQSTRPGAEILTSDQEWDRIKKPIEQIRKAFPSAWLSVDTFHAEVARRSIDAGVDIINDISFGNDDKRMIDVVSGKNITYIGMHKRGNAQTMQNLTSYSSITDEVQAFLETQRLNFSNAGVKNVWIDPGFGFAKTIDQNFELINGLSKICDDYPSVLAGISRKSSIYKTLHINAEDALNGTTFMHGFLLSSGVKILRVHDVKEAVEACTLFEKIASNPS
jgi:dihydropteroate synthase